METSGLGLPWSPQIPQTPLEVVPSLVHSFIFIHPFAHSENTRQPCAVCTACRQPEGKAFASCCVLSLSFLICEEGLALLTHLLLPPLYDVTEMERCGVGGRKKKKKAVPHKLLFSRVG